MEGQRITLPALTQRRQFSLDGTRYESFNTSGGLGSLGRTYLGRVDNMNYKTIRYPGHCEQMRLLIRNHGVPIQVGLSTEPIPLHFALGDIEPVP